MFSSLERKFQSVPLQAAICSEAQKGSILRGYAFTDGALRIAVRINTLEPSLIDTGLSHVLIFAVSSQAYGIE